MDGTQPCTKFDLVAQVCVSLVSRGNSVTRSFLRILVTCSCCTQHDRFVLSVLKRLTLLLSLGFY